MAFVHYLTRPELRNPVLIAAFAGWNDAADAATTAIKVLMDRWEPTRFAEIEPEEFYDFTETRPTVSANKGRVRTISWPSNTFMAYTNPAMQHDMILFLGTEPQLKWKTFASTFLEVCKQFHVSEVVMLGAFLANIPHSFDVPISGLASTPEMQERLSEIDVQGTRYEGPTGIVGVLQEAINNAKIPVSSLWAAAPHYLVATPNIKVTAALLTYTNVLLSLDLDLRDIQADAINFEEQITRLVARDPDASAYVRKLEEQIEQATEEGEEGEEDEEEDEEEEGEFPAINPDRPTSSGPLPSADALIRRVEELLRKERENNQHNDSGEEQR
jgi:proteasome assembly chaperone (PAC2) family protein